MLATIPIIIGPTGVGKTSLAILLAVRSPIPIEIVSLDSVMLYKELNIGAAKPTLKERRGVPHHLIDVTSVTQPWSLGKVWEQLKMILPSILERGHLPMLVGGTMLYYRALIDGLSKLPATTSAVKQRLAAELQTLGTKALYDKLRQVDSITAQYIDPNNPARIMRALAVFEQTGRPLSLWQQECPPEHLPYQWSTLIINDPITSIRQRIAIRMQQMLEQGWLEETTALYQQFAPKRPQPLNSVGYRQLWDYLEGRYDYPSALQLIAIATGNLAKRQQTWIKSFTHPVTTYYLSSDDPSKPFNWFKHQLTNYRRLKIRS